MKKERTLFLIVLFAAWQAVAQQRTNATSTTSASHTNAPSASATFKAPKPTLHWFGPAQPSQNQENPRYVEGLDTHAWSTVAEFDSRKTAFPDAETHEAGFSLLWWGTEPRPK
jgi:hypothetical protein